jgi:hypothetical protein
MVQQSYSPGSVMKQDKTIALAAPPPCKHHNLVPLEFRFAKVTYPNGYESIPNYDYTTTIMTANVCRVKLYICLDCKEEIKAPQRKE